MFVQIKKFLICVLTATSLIFVLTACQSNSAPENFNSSADYWQGMQERLQKLQEVHLRGSIAFNHQGDRFGAYFNYKSQGKNWKFILTSSFGTEIATLTVTEKMALLNYSARSFKAPTAQELFEKVLDISLPVDDFPKIMLAIALDENSFIAPQGFVVQSKVQQFLINYLDYNTQNEIAVPSHFMIEGPQDRIEMKVNTIVKLQ